MKILTVGRRGLIWNVPKVLLDFAGKSVGSGIPDQKSRYDRGFAVIPWSTCAGADEMSNCQSLYHLSVCESLKIEIKEGINFFCSLLATQRAGEMGWGVHWVLCLPRACLGLPQVGFVTFVSSKLPKVPAGLLLADLRCSPLWASYLISWFHTNSSTCSPWLLSLDFTCLPRSSPAVFIWNFLCAPCLWSPWFLSLLCFLPELFHLQT